jgi:hypothetical protein
MEGIKFGEDDEDDGMQCSVSYPYFRIPLQVDAAVF